MVLCAAALCICGCEQPAGPIAGIPPERAPAAPEQLWLLAEDGVLAAGWDTVPGADSYRVWYGTGSGFEAAGVWNGSVTLEAGTASTLITGLQNGVLYYVWVTAVNSGGESGPSAYAYEKPVRGFSNRPRVFFDHGWMIPSYEEAAERFYTVRQGASVVLSPVHWKISDTASYAWTVTEGGAYSGSGENSRYFRFTPDGTGDYRVQVTVNDNDTEYTASTKVVSTGSYQVRSGTSPKARNAFGFMPAPGQFVNIYPGGSIFSAVESPQTVAAKAQRVVDGAGSEWRFSLGSFGGYLITGFDHSVANTDGGYELTIKGNAFGNWGEPGVVWVSRDDNGNNQPDDTWYELKGSQHGSGDTKQYAITWFKPQMGRRNGVWMDNRGEMGTYPKGFPYLDRLDYVTITGTQLRAAAGGWGYVDILGNERFRISDAVQADGSPANLDYIDFVKVQNAVYEMAGAFGEISCETGVPFDLSIPNPSLLVRGAPVTEGEYMGQYRYHFPLNGSGYDMFISLDGGEFFEHPRSSMGGTAVTKYLAGEQVYIDYYGGNVLHDNTTPGIITFRAR
jgi:hypothetical protein